jgi:hypothetical protein
MSTSGGNKILRRVIGVAALVIVSVSGIWGALDILVRKRSPPQCGSPMAEDWAKRAFAAVSVAKSTGVSIVDFQNVRDVSFSDTDRECTARVTLNNATDHEVRYSISFVGNQWLTSIQVLNVQPPPTNTKCVSDCTSQGYLYQICVRRCSSRESEPQQSGLGPFLGR